MTLEWVETRNALFVPRYRGQLLCSSIDPISEAKKWVEKSVYSKESFEVFFVLGLAGGFHIQQLALMHPKSEIIVIEAHSELADELLSRRGPLPQNVTLVCGWDASKITDNVFVKSALRSLYRTLKYPTSFRLDKSYYEQVERQLLPRSYDGLKAQLEMRREQKELFQSLSEVDKEFRTTEITVLEIERAIRRRAKALEPEAMVWMALRELIR